MIRYLLPCAAFLLLNTSIVHAQVEKTFFQTYNIIDGAQHIFVQSVDPFELRSWNGVQLMIETTARLDGGNMDLLGFVIKDGRYSYYFEQGTEAVVFRPKISIRPGLKYLGLMCHETIKTFIYVPEEFNIVNKNELVRKEIIVAKNK